MTAAATRRSSPVDSGAPPEACPVAGRSVRRPRTPAGRFLRATATNDRADATTPDDAARALFARAFALAVRLRFGPDAPLVVIAGSVARAARRHAELMVPAREAEMLIREVLGESVPTAGIEPGQAVRVHVLVFAALVEELALTDDELDELIADAEDGAGDRAN